MTASAGAWRWPVLLALFAASWAAFLSLHPEHLFKIGIGHYRVEVAPQRFHEIWFLDTFAILAANDAVAAGRDPYQRNPLDFMQRPHVYGPWWLQLRHLGWTRSDVRWLGLVLGLAFLTVAVAWLRPRSAGEMLWAAALLGSTPVLSALERANNDLVIFLVLAPVVPCLLSRRAAVRWLSVFWLALATELKVYPAVAFLLLLTGGDPAERRARVAVGVAVLALVTWHVAHNFVPLRTVLPPLTGVFNFGAEIILRELGATGAVLWWGPAVAAGLIFAAGWRSSLLRGWQPAPAQQTAWLHFILGAVMLAGCFFAGQHFAYRWIFALWLAPFLWSAAMAQPTPAPVRTLARVTGALLLLQLWIESLGVLACHRLPEAELQRALRGVWLGVQPITWALMGCLLLFLAHFARDGLRGLAGRERALQEAAPVGE